MSGKAKVLFLDIDGVLNKDSTKEKIDCGNYKGFTGVDAKLVKKYLDWKKDKDITVCLSSTWRNFPETFEYLNNQGIEWDYVTPRTLNRSNDIFCWLEKYDKLWSHYAILDDIQEAAKGHGNHFVQTSYKTGVTKKHLERVSKILCLE